ncbi:MAG: DUF1801 domain-containing protein [Aggregatilineales bacterium]
MNDAVTEYIQNIKQDWQPEICTKIREIIFEAIPDVEERIQYGKPHYRKNNTYACVLGTAKGWVSFTIFNATALDAPEGFFEADGPPERKTIKIKQNQEVDYALLAKLIKQAADTI